MPLSSPRTRKLAGSLALAVFVIVYALAAALAGALLVSNAPEFLEALYYIIAGIAWIFPARAMIRWMQRTGGESGVTPR